QYAHVDYPLQSHGLAAPWEREDALWYEKIADRGYALDGTTAFFPLLPLLMRAVSPFTGGNIPLAGLLVAGVAAAVALALLYRLAEHDTDAATAGRTVAYLALFPTAFFLYAAFTESLFLAVVLGAFWCARGRHWGAVAGLAALAGLTRVQGALLGLPLAVEYLSATGWNRARLRQRLPVLVLVAGAGALGTLAFFAYVTYVVHDPYSWSARETLQWQQQFSWPWDTLGTALAKAVTPGAELINQFDLGVLAVFSGLTVASFRLRPAYGLLAATVLVSTWFHVRADFPLVSVSRYVLVAFPCFLVLAIWAGRRRIVHLGIVAFWGIWLLVWSSQVVRGYWVG
ncbi:MAG TPA: hypothetical protein VM536_17265, partial [Chloroflexia bacterium]|nr:hypothetical protein [Chloroflexia bacterium]